MSDPDLGKSASKTRKTRDTAMLLPLVGAFLLLSPLITIFVAPATLFGLPSIFVYIFGVWLGLVLLARALAQRLDPG